MTKKKPTPKTTIRISLPLPLDVSGTLISLIGATWPGATIDTTAERALVIGIDPADRALVSAEELVEIKEDHAGDDGDFQGFEDGSVVLTPNEELQAKLSETCRALLDSNPDAINYMEWTVVERAEPKNRFVISAARSPEQTPHELRMKAEATLAKIKTWAEERHLLAPGLLEELFEILPGVQMTPETRETFLTPETCPACGSAAIQHDDGSTRCAQCDWQTETDAEVAQ